MTKFALLSVSDKRGLAEFAAALCRRHGYTLLSTGGTAKLLREKGLPVTDVSQHTGFPEIMDGRVKTLHPKIHGGLLCRRDKPDQLAQAAANGIALIDLVVVNLYPFEQTVAKPEVSFEEAVENIDIGGPSMLRSAAKNHESVTVVCDPDDYAAVLATLDKEKGEGRRRRGWRRLRRRLALKVFQRTASYDAAIAHYLESSSTSHLPPPAFHLPSGEPDLAAIAGFPETLTLSWKKAQALRYGENPHQQAALYGSFHDHFRQLQGKELSYNNILDVTAAAWLIGEFERPTVAILKHTNPCGVASADTLDEAWGKAYATDRQAPFGGVIIVNRTLEGALAKVIAEIFTEVIIAPRFSDEALLVFARKKNLRLMAAQSGPGAGGPASGERVDAPCSKSAPCWVVCWCRTAIGRLAISRSSRSSPGGSPRPRNGRRCCLAGRSASTSSRMPSFFAAANRPWGSARGRWRGSTARASPCGRRARRAWA